MIVSVGPLALEEQSSIRPNLSLIKTQNTLIKILSFDKAIKITRIFSRENNLSSNSIAFRYRKLTDRNEIYLRQVKFKNTNYFISIFEFMGIYQQQHSENPLHFLQMKNPINLFHQN